MFIINLELVIPIIFFINNARINASKPVRRKVHLVDVDHVARFHVCKVFLHYFIGGV